MNNKDHKRRFFVSPFSTLTSLVFLLFLAGCGQNGAGGTSLSSSTVQADNQPGANVVAGAFSSLHMIDAMVGWGCQLGCCWIGYL